MAELEELLFSTFSGVSLYYPVSVKIADSLPTSWFRGKNECLPQLQSFKNHLVQKAHNICKHQPPEAPDTRYWKFNNAY